MIIFMYICMNSVENQAEVNYLSLMFQNLFKEFHILKCTCGVQMKFSPKPTEADTHFFL